jgi:DNA-binding SARP family transcriptional activator
MSIVRLSLLGDCVIQVNDTVVDPSSTHLFALLLFLGLESERRVSRAELHRLLFAPNIGTHQASHNLRQLLYRVRRLGVVLDETALGLRLTPGGVVSYDEQLQVLTNGDCGDVDSANVAVMSSYYPKLPQPYLEWLDRARDVVDSVVRTSLLRSLTRLREAHNWLAASRVGGVLLAIDPYSEEATRGTAEAFAMMGRREDALRLLDSFSAASQRSTTPLDGLRSLRMRVAKTNPAQRVGALRGRTECLALLTAEWTAASDGGARLTTLVGAPGIGKTRAANEFAASIGFSGAKVIHHKCDISSLQFSLSLFAGILPDLWEMRGSLGIAPHHRSVLGRLSPTANAVNAPATGVALEVLREDLGVALMDLLEAVSSERQLLIVVDDAHLLDDTSLALIKHLSTSDNSAALLIIACWRPRDRISALLSTSTRSTSYILPELNEVDSRLLVQDLVADGQRVPEHLDWCVTQARGNPFFLHSLSRLTIKTTSVPFDIISLASSSYYSLGPSARLTLESCLYLNTLASLDRLVAITGLDDLLLLEALRELETSDLVCLEGHVVRGPHGLLDEALRALIPSTVSALIHRRVALTLTSECSLATYSIPLALAAARSWLAYGDAAQAEALLRRCAADIAAIGDPTAAAALLAQIAFTTTPNESRRVLLDDVIMYAEAGGARETLVQALNARLDLATYLGESPLEISRMQFRLVEVALFSDHSIDEAVPRLTAMLESPSIDDDLRLQCIATLLIIADAHYDWNLARQLVGLLSSLTEGEAEHSPYALRALLIYHTTFGDKRVAYAIANEMTHRFATPGMDDSCRSARRSSSYALYRMMRHESAKKLLVDDYNFMSSRGIRSEALYAASLLTEIEIASGDFTAARSWFREVDAQLQGGVAHNLSPNSGYYSSAALFAMMDGDYGKAHSLLSIPLTEDPRMRTPRYEAIITALRLRSHFMEGTLVHKDELVDNLKRLYKRGQSLGGQDTVVELLWSAEVLAGNALGASDLLQSYLTDYRREERPVEWFLRTTTSADESWSVLDAV